MVMNDVFKGVCGNNTKGFRDSQNRIELDAQRSQTVWRKNTLLVM